MGVPHSRQQTCCAHHSMCHHTSYALVCLTRLQKIPSSRCAHKRVFVDCIISIHTADAPDVLCDRAVPHSISSTLQYYRHVLCCQLSHYSVLQLCQTAILEMTRSRTNIAISRDVVHQHPPHMHHMLALASHTYCDGQINVSYTMVVPTCVFRPITSSLTITLI